MIKLGDEIIRFVSRPGNPGRDGTSGIWPGNPAPSRYSPSREYRDIRVGDLGLKYFLYLHV